MTYRTTVHRADHGMGIAMPEGGFWRPLIMTQGLSSGDTGASPLITILWEQVSERPRHTDFTRPSKYPPGHEEEAAFRHDTTEYSGEIGDCPPGDLGNEVR